MGLARQCSGSRHRSGPVQLFSPAPRFNQVTPFHHLAFVFVSHVLQYSQCDNKIAKTLV